MNEVKKMSLSVMTTELSTSEMEMIQAGSGWGCALAIGSFVGSSVALAGTGASVVFAGLGIALWYGSILGLAACA